MARSDENQRVDSIGLEKEIFNTTGVLEEIFTFTGSVAYYPNGIMDVSIQRNNKTWEELSPTLYTLLAGGVGIQLNPGKRVTANSKLRVVYGSPTKMVNGSISVATAPPTAIYGGSVTMPVTPTIVVLPPQALLDGVVVKADENNANPLSVNGFSLSPGESVPIAIDNLNRVRVSGGNPDVLWYLGS